MKPISYSAEKIKGKLSIDLKKKKEEELWVSRNYKIKSQNCEIANSQMPQWFSLNNPQLKV